MVFTEGDKELSQLKKAQKMKVTKVFFANEDDLEEVDSILE